MIKTGKLTIVREGNFQEILDRIQSMCNKHRMLSKYQIFKGDLNHEEKSYRINSFGWFERFEKFGDNIFDYKKIKKYEVHDIFFKVEKHGLRTKYEDCSIYDFDLKSYKKFKSYISMFHNGCCNLVISDGDKVTFTKDGGVIIYTTNKDTHFDGSKPITIYKQTLIPNRISGKIKSLKDEIEKLNEEADKECEYWDRQFEKEMDLYYENEEDKYDELI